MFKFCRLFFEGCSILNQPVPIANSYFLGFFEVIYLCFDIPEEKEGCLCVCFACSVFVCVWMCVCVCCPCSVVYVWLCVCFGICVCVSMMCVCAHVYCDLFCVCAYMCL